MSPFFLFVLLLFFVVGLARSVALARGPAFELELWGAPFFEVGRAGILT
jgi:hypothetical protein